VDHLDGRQVGAPSLPQLFCAPHLRYVEVSGRIVMLDLSAGAYDVTNEVGAAMWAQLIELPTGRDIAGLAQQYGISTSEAESDLIDFATAQLAAGRLVMQRPDETGPPLVDAPRRRPTALRAWRERASSERDLQKGFANAYTARTRPTADATAPRVDVTRLTEIFRTAEGLFPAREAPQDCLPRSLALTRFLRTAGWQAEHVIGIALYPFEAHAWVELDGVPLNEGTTYLQRFTVIQRA
jgi:hypothetical protein